MKNKTQTTTVLVHNGDPNEERLAGLVAEKKKLDPETIQVVDFDLQQVSNYTAHVVHGGPEPLPQRDIIVKVKYRVVKKK